MRVSMPDILFLDAVAIVRAPPVPFSFLLNALLLPLPFLLKPPPFLLYFQLLEAPLLLLFCPLPFRLKPPSFFFCPPVFVLPLPCREDGGPEHLHDPPALVLPVRRLRQMLRSA